MRALNSELAALWRARTLLVLMARRELAARHAGSILGIAWLYAQPLLTIAVYYLVFDLVFKMRLGAGTTTTAVGTYLIVGLVPWMAFCDAIARGMGSLIEAGPLLQKNPLPTALFPARAVLTGAFVYLPLTLVLVLAYAPAHSFGAALLLLPILLLVMLFTWFLLAYALAILVAAVRDIAQVVGFFLGIGAFLSPVLFLPSMFPQPLQWALWLNPMTPPVLGLQSLLLDARVPDAEVWGAMAAWFAGAALLLDRLVAGSREQLIDWL